MAISGGTSATVLASAQKYGLSHKEIADVQNVTPWPAARTVATTDQTGHVGRVTWTNFDGMVSVDFGDGTVVTAASSVGHLDHTYAGAGTYTARVTGYGYTKAAAAQAIA